MPIGRAAGFGFLAFTFVVVGVHTSCNSSKNNVTAGSASVAAPLGVAPDLDARMAKFKPLDMPLNRSGLSARELQLVQKLVDASNAIEQIYWRQSDPEGLALYAKLEKSQDPLDQKVLRFLKINGSRYDLIDELKPFVGTQPAAPGRALYPASLTRDDIEKYVAANPVKKDAVYDERSVLQKNGMQLESVPYHAAFPEFLKKAAQDLREGAALSDDPAFAKFLRLRADALLSDDYYQSDLAWLDLKDPKFDLIVAPYESYLDNLLGVRTSYGAAVLIRNDAESQKLAVFQKYVAQLQDALPLDKKDLPSKHGHVTPMEVMDAPFRTGTCCMAIKLLLTICPTIPKSTRQRAARKYSSRISWMHA